MAFQKGQPRPVNAGRKAGIPNKVTSSVREAFERAFNLLQQDDKAKLEAWAKANTTEFYKLAAKLIPVDMAVQGGITLNVVTGVPQAVAEGEDDGSDLV